MVFAHHLIVTRRMVTLPEYRNLGTLTIRPCEESGSSRHVEVAAASTAQVAWVAPPVPPFGGWPLDAPRPTPAHDFMIYKALFFLQPTKKELSISFHATELNKLATPGLEARHGFNCSCLRSSIGRDYVAHVAKNLNVITDTCAAEYIV